MRNYEKYLRRFVKEGKILAQICQSPHPHIVRVSDLFYEDDLPCLVMDFIAGENLYHLVGEKGKLREQEAVEYIEQIGSALAVCHQGNIIHRDAHPGNMILRADTGTAILIDFGLAGELLILKASTKQQIRLLLPGSRCWRARKNRSLIFSLMTDD